MKMEPDLKKQLIFRFALMPIFIALLILLPAGTLNFWEVYLYFGTLLPPMFFALFYFIKKDPKLLERRMRTEEKEKPQKKIIFLMIVTFLTGYMLPGFDHRYNWSEVPTIIVIIMDILVLLSYLSILLVFKENNYASRIIEVEADQKVISTGPYALVRHPMYLAILILYLATPVALGSYWAIIPFTILPVLLVLRILNEEKVLREKLEGYQEYCQQVKFRMIPFIW